MARGTHAGYTIPTSTGLGQGGAQVFSPQPVQLDTTGLQRGILAAGQGIASGIAQKAEMDDAKKRRRMELAEKAYNQDTFFPQTEALKNRAVEEYLDPKSDRYDDYSALKRDLGYIKTIDTNAKEGYKQAQDQTGVYKDALYYDEELGGYDSPIAQYEFLAEADIDDIDDLQLWAADTANRLQPQRNENIIYNPKFDQSDFDKAMLDELNSVFKARGEQNLNAVYDDKSGKLIVAETGEAISEEDFQNAVRAIKYNRPEFMASYMTSKLIEEGNAPHALQDKNAVGIYQKGYESAIEEAAERYRPQKTTVKTLKNTGDVVGAPSTKYEISYGGAEEAQYKNGKIKLEPSIILGDVSVKGEKVVGLTRKDGREAAIVARKEDGELKRDILPDSSLVEGYKNEVKNRASGAEKSTVVDAINKFEKSPTREADVTEEMKSIESAIKEQKARGFLEGGELYSGDNEEKVVKMLEEMGYDTENLESSLKGVFGGLIGGVPFDDEKAVRRFVEALVRAQPQVAARRQQPTEEEQQVTEDFWD